MTPASLAEDLHDAMLGGEMHLHYQPLYDICDGAVACVEALLRWTHPQCGNIPPSVFIPMAEDSGLILAVGQWVLREACAEAASWPHPVLLAVNISPLHFKEPGLLATVAEILADTGLPADRLVLEITEGLQLVRSDAVLDTLQRLRALGVWIALDDFGVGYANLSRLRDLPFDVVKIDRSFLDDPRVDHPLVALLAPLVAFARGYAPRIVMEGVETTAQLALVKALNCDWVQGFYLSEPISAEALRPLLRRPQPAETRLAH